MERTEIYGKAILFCPADRPDRYEKALTRADMVIFDLEDAVGADQKVSARERLEQFLASLSHPYVVRINPRGTPWHADDVAMLHRLGNAMVMAPKIEFPEDLDELYPLKVIALCETSMGVWNARQIATVDNCCALMWGGEDLTAEIGGRASRGASGAYHPSVDYARSRVLLAASSAGIYAIDGVYVDINDVTGLAEEARAGADMGFAAKACIHPSHASIIRDAYLPAAEEYEWAGALLTQMEKVGGGVFIFEGKMVDGPMYEHARNVVRAYETSEAQGAGASGRKGDSDNV